MVFQSLQLSCRLEHAPAIKKALSAGKSVIADRYTASGIVYGGADGLDMHYLDDIQASLPQPTLQILLDIDPEDARRRMQDRGEKLDRYEAKEGFMAEVAKRYRLLFENKARTAYTEVTTFWSVIDARGSVVETAAKIIEEVKQVRNYFHESEHASQR
jgi:dTMP kinase